jgi:hypothetical protein
MPGAIQLSHVAADAALTLDFRLRGNNENGKISPKNSPLLSVWRSPIRPLGISE